MFREIISGIKAALALIAMENLITLQALARDIASLIVKLKRIS